MLSCDFWMHPEAKLEKLEEESWEVDRREVLSGNIKVL